MRPGEILNENIQNVKDLAERYHVRELRVFGSVARHEDGDNSDIDLLALYTDDATILDHAAFAYRLKELLGIECDVLSDEILDKAGFEDMMADSVTLNEFADGRYVAHGAVAQEEREAAGDDNLRWIVRRIADTIADMSYDEFMTDPIRYDALAYQFQLMSSIIGNADPERVEAFGRSCGVDFTGCAALQELLLTTTYPRMLYQTARKLKNGIIKAQDS